MSTFSLQQKGTVLTGFAVTVLGLALSVAQFVLGPELEFDAGLEAEFPAVVAVEGAQGSNDWPQLQHDAQRTGYTSGEVRPPYIYLWKWNEVPFASRTQPVVADGRLFIGGLDGVMYARDALTGAPLWSYATGGPIRHTAAAYEAKVFFGSHDGKVYALDAGQGDLLWQFQTGGGVATAPAVASDTVYIGSTDGLFYALDAENGDPHWPPHPVGAPILTSAALSLDGDTVYFGAEDITAYALDTSSGALRWSTRLQGQSLADRWPVVVGDAAIYRSQSLHNFHNLLHEGDDVMDQAGAVNPDWAADWAQVRSRIVDFLADNPDRQTFFVLEAATGALRGPAPMLYTYGNQDNPGPPVVRGEEIYTLFRARHGIQQDAGSVHVTTLYDAALGRMDLTTLDVTNLTLAPGQQWNLHYRATSDEPAVLSMAGNMLFVDTWTRLGGIDVDTGELFEVANVADDWPECWDQCVGRAGPMPFFDSYPFPGPRVGEARVHRPAVVANGVIYWRVIEGGLAAIGHSTGAQSQPYLWPSRDVVRDQPQDTLSRLVAAPSLSTVQSLSDYVWNEPFRPVPFPDGDLVALLEEEIQAIANAGHLAPFFLERGFTTPEGVPGDSAHPEDGLAAFGPYGNVYWFDPGELVYT
ncbi:MAG: PQQ-like beta-propeller repeat protein, partial [Planctomycetes bacterium]|nr:PQQ-like beta-propeller repeat protein [Planctomycetota bacterium]